LAEDSSSEAEDCAVADEPEDGVEHDERPRLRGSASESRMRSGALSRFIEQTGGLEREIDGEYTRNPFPRKEERGAREIARGGGGV
jgi:hypothetical protein